MAQPWTPGATMLKADDVKITSESATSFDRISSGYRTSGGGGTDLSMRTKQRKRKDRRDSYSELHDKKFSRSRLDNCKLFRSDHIWADGRGKHYNILQRPSF